MSYTCNGKVWRTGNCGSGTEICAGCSSTCTCNSGFSFRPCIVNLNWGGSGTTCSAASQRLFMEIGGAKKTTTTSTSTTTTTTTAVKVTMKTFMLPEASSWKITSGKKTVCAGKGYTEWYSSIKVDCKLVYKRRYKITCTNPKIGGWAGGYLEVKGNKLCQKYEWSQGSNFNEYFTAR